jgi:uncharacterized pyridoxamine 5'-phosphate oxidase family protein
MSIKQEIKQEEERTYCSWCKSNALPMSGIFLLCGHEEDYALNSKECPYYKQIENIPNCHICGHKAFVNYKSFEMEKQLPYCFKHFIKNIKEEEK